MSLPDENELLEELAYILDALKKIDKERDPLIEEINSILKDLYSNPVGLKKIVGKYPQANERDEDDERTFTKISLKSTVTSNLKNILLKNLFKWDIKDSAYIPSYIFGITFLGHIDFTLEEKELLRKYLLEWKHC